MVQCIEYVMMLSSGESQGFILGPVLLNIFLYNFLVYKLLVILHKLYWWGNSLCYWLYFRKNPFQTKKSYSKFVYVVCSKWNKSNLSKYHMRLSTTKTFKFQILETIVRNSLSEKLLLYLRECCWISVSLKSFQIRCNSKPDTLLFSFSLICKADVVKKAFFIS